MAKITFHPEPPPATLELTGDEVNTVRQALNLAQSVARIPHHNLPDCLRGKCSMQEALKFQELAKALADSRL